MSNYLLDRLKRSPRIELMTVFPADDDHVLVAGTLGIARHRPVVHPSPAEAIDTVSLQLPPLGARRDHHRAPEYVPAIV